MQNINALHKKLCPQKCLGNFWRSEDFKTVARLLEAEKIPVDNRVVLGSRGHPGKRLVHPLVALAFMRWADPDLFYSRLYSTLFNAPST